MLRELELHGVGPASHMVMADIGSRFNVIAGDNGLGKSFLLEVAWWALTRTWHESPAVPSANDASISFAFDGDQKLHRDRCAWSAAGQEWKRQAGRPPNPGLVIYARVDGSFSVWDPARNYRLYQRRDNSEASTPPAYQFSASDALWGLRGSSSAVLHGAGVATLCEGLVSDWRTWQLSGDERFTLLTSMLTHLGPEGEPLQPGQLVRPSVEDVRLLPSIQMPYRADVPITYAPAGVKRICLLAYLLAWTFSEHRAVAERIGQPLARQVTVLLDEPETHLHPRWQRTVLPSLLRAIAGWNHGPEVQLLVATHSPMVLASLEPYFDLTQDRVWTLDFDKQSTDVLLRSADWTRHGDVSRWLTSDVFDLRYATSREAEEVLKQAEDIYRQGDSVSDEAVAEVDDRLGALLNPHDPAVYRWRALQRTRLQAMGRL